MVIGHAGVLVPDSRCKEFQKPAGGLVAGTTIEAATVAEILTLVSAAARRFAGSSSEGMV